MFSFFFGCDRVINYEDVAGNNVEQFNAFFHKMLEQGIYLAPSAFEAGFLSAQLSATKNCEKPLRRRIWHLLT